ncbi:Small G protein signaling modulator 3, partial [Branchiostoma belcheri]
VKRSSPRWVKAKNIKQTEMVSNLREAILQIAKHFQSVDPKNCNLDLQADYSLESHKQDHENFVNVSRNRRRRAKALLDFERHDDDELGFRKNDIITIISQKDEHCWVGELNGLRGWFPAKFVELLDERRSKLYTTAGDDQVTEAITDLVRGTLCPALKMIFDHGLRQPSILGRTCHPWLFIEEDPEQKAGIAVSRMLTTPYKQTARQQVSTTVTPSQPLPLKKYICTSLPNKAALSAWLPPAAQREVEKDFDSVYSRLVLCKTYRLDEDGKVLTPEELLYRAVQSVNMTHDTAHACMDVKFRSWICYGLNEQVLHLWLEALCSCDPAVEKWYHSWSFLRSPGWVQIKCELRLLSKFSFNLSQDWELPNKKEAAPIQVSQPLKEGVRDMLVKHHLFSWEL